MSVVILDGSTVREFVEEEAVFNKTIDEKFHTLDVNNDGVLSRCEMRRAFESLRLLESHLGVEVKQTPDQLNALYNSVFDRFDRDHDNNVDLLEFRSEMKKIMLAIADGLGTAPIQLLVNDDSLLKEAVELESSKAQYELSLQSLGTRFGRFTSTFPQDSGGLQLRKRVWPSILSQPLTNHGHLKQEAYDSEGPMDIGST